MKSKAIGFAVLLAGACVTSAFADVVISTDATQNMSCSGGVCVPTASDAVLNVTDLENLLASGNVSVATTNGSIQADNIDIVAAFSWSAANSLTLDAYQSVTFSAVVQNLSSSGVSLTTNDGGRGGALTFAIGSGRLDTNAVSIDGESYTMAKSVKQLAAEVVAEPGGHFGLSKDTDAGKEGLYYESPIPVPFDGAFNGLGHSISKLEIADLSGSSVGLFATVKKNASIASVSMRNVVVRGPTSIWWTGLLVGENDGAVSNVFASGSVRGGYAGGLVGLNNSSGSIAASQSTVTVDAADDAGGLVGENEGTVSSSLASGKVSGHDEAGGLIAGAGGIIQNCYATGVVTGKRRSLVGGLFGGSSSVASSYAIGAVRGGKKALVGGFDGIDEGTITNGYWDTDTSGTNQGSGDGNETGLTGLTTAQFQSGLPAGFDSSIWAENASINNGFPYLIANPPAQ